MASKPLNSSNGFSVGSNGNVIIDSAGNITTDSIIVAQYANLGNIANVKITGGSNGQSIVTDGAGNLSFAAGGSSGNLFITSPMPFLIPPTETYYVTANHQGLFTVPIEINGALEVDGVLVDVTQVTSQSFAGNVTTGNLISQGNVNANYVVANYFVGNGSQLTGITVGAGSSIINGSSNIIVYENANIGVTVSSIANVVLFKSTGISVSGVVSASGNVIGGNLIIGGQISATGNGTFGNVTATTFTGALSGAATSATTAGTVTTAAQPNITSVGTLTSVSVSGNANVGNIGTGGLITATGNITGGNIITGGLLTATGNITGGNIITAGIMSSTGNATHGNISVGGTITANGSTNATAFAVGNSAVSNVALGYFPTAGTAAEMAIRDYSTVATTMYFDAGMGSNATGSQFRFRGSNAYTEYATINQYGVNLPTRPAFRVTGSGTTNNLTTTQNGNGQLNINNYAVDYNQGTGFNSSTGTFTAPVAGLYSISVVGRNSGYSSGISQLAVVKNISGSSTVQAMIEWASSSTMNHVGSSTIAKLAVNDTLTLRVLAGQINFDGNDNWSVAYIG